MRSHAPSRTLAIQTKGMLGRAGRSLLAPFGRDVIAVAALLCVMAGSAAAAPVRDLAGARKPSQAAPIVAGFSVSNDLSDATVVLLNAGGLAASGPDGPLSVDTQGALRIPLHFEGVSEPSTVTVTFAGVASGDLEVSYYPRAYYQGIGVDSNGTVLLFTTFSRIANSRSGEQVDLPPAESLDIDEQRWTDARYVGALPPASEAFEEQIRRLYIQFDELNDPGVKRLCADSMTGIDTYWAMTNRTCYVWCSGYSRILSGFLRSINIPARMVSLSADVGVLPGGIVVQSSEGHASVEMWVGGQWQWVDPTFRLLLAADSNGRPLTIEAVTSDLTNPAVKDTLRFTRLDPATNGWTTLSYRDEDQEFKDDLARYLSADKLITVPNGGRG